MQALRDAGAHVEVPFSSCSVYPRPTGRRFLAPECYALHRRHVERDPDAFDPRVIVRILRASEQTAADYVDLLHARADIQAECARVSRLYDGVLMPTVPTVAPPIVDLEASDSLYGKTNLLMLRNPLIGNFLDRCAATVPISPVGEAPVGLMIMGERGADDAVLSIATALERLLSPKIVG